MTSADAGPVPSKADLRAQALARRRETQVDADAFAAHLAQAGAALVEKFRPGVVSAYFSLRDEASTALLLERLAADGARTALPITGRRGTPLVFRLWRPGDPLVEGKMGIAEPAPEAPEVAPDLLFVPLAAFDRAGHRIGYGAGFYDRTLAGLRAVKPIVAVGVAYASQEAAKIPHEDHDEPLDFVLTEKELIACRPSPPASAA
ncbi:5-formyltetrahydrofolate cyclo-ligase [Methylocella sp.]|uniref:5-formyltetrahydrofolate cyclo-ligase n=1 Tax=Methylocella sp. TaxID=1978226 RepID=UPI0037849296